MIRRIRWGRVVIAALICIVLLASAWAVAALVIRDQHERGELDLLQELWAAYGILAERPDFIRMRPEGEWLRLYMQDGTELCVSVPKDFASRFDLPWHDAFRLSGGWKQGDDVFFITGGAVDDCWGYVLTADDAVSMEGLHQLDRVGGGAFRFSTMKE